MSRAAKDYDPVCIRRLMEKVDDDSVRAAHLMGCHPSTVLKAIQSGSTTRKQEEQAASAMDRLLEEESQARVKAANEVAANSAQLLVTVPPEKFEAFQKVAAVMGCEMVAL